ncbi:MAG TPA: hypothetical protein VFS47_10315 [Steroidobacteraceae bacterium]|nr:hypothetical protein [Steroidobacteraceae bacterium]
MPSPIRGSTLQHREPLSTGWDFCAVSPDAVASPGELNEGLNWLTATVPCTAASALRSLGQWSFDAPSRRFDADDWWFRCEFGAQRRSGRIVLGLDGLATLADVWFNGEKILSSDNMFVAHEIDITERIKSKNELHLRFRSLDKALTAKRPRPRWKAPMIENQQLRWFRTTVLGRTPGWSPSAAAVGPWRPVWIEYRNDVAISSVQLRTSVAGASGTAHVSLQHSSFKNSKLTGAELILSKDEQRFSHPLTITDSTAHGELTVPNAERWWPHTHGTPTLYSAQLELKIESDGDQLTVQRLDIGQVGFRTVRVDTTDGQFRVLVNEVPIFCRGACWTPIDVVTLRASEAEYRSAIEQVRDAGMNMIRVGGTMVYEQDALLHECDRNGVLIWQDLMFANMDFPHGDTAFDASVERELRQELTRLASHPSLAVLCGNSEVEQQAAMFGATRDRWTPALFHDFIPKLTEEICPDVPYWPSSAHGGSFPHQPNVGTTSYYGVGAYLRSLEDARRSEVKFASECLAFANIPEDETIAKMPKGLALRVHHPEWKSRTPRDLGAGWDFEDVRDHYVKELFGVDVMSLRYSDHDRYLQLGRIATGQVMAATFAEWRRKRSVCGGGLVWFLRDLIPGAGWGVVDSFGQPKAAYYALKRTLQPVAVFISDEGCNGLSIHVANDLGCEFSGRLVLSLYRNNAAPGTHSDCSITVPSRSSMEMPANEFLESFSDLAYAYRFGPKTYEVIAARLEDQRGAVVSDCIHANAGTSMQSTADIGLQATTRIDDSGCLVLEVSTKRFAYGVHIDIPHCSTPDNYFHLAPGCSRSMRIAGIPAGGLVQGRLSALNSSMAVPIS